MTTPTLAQFAKALDAVRQKHPQAPGLPEGYYFRDLRGIGTVLYFNLPPASTDLVARHAALAICVTTAMEIGAWYCGTTPGSYFDMQRHGKHWHYTLCVGGHEQDDSHASLPSAALAMLEVIGEV